VHVLIIPKNKQGLSGISKAKHRHTEILGQLLLSATSIAELLNIDKDGYRIVINEGKHGCNLFN